MKAMILAALVALLAGCTSPGKTTCGGAYGKHCGCPATHCSEPCSGCCKGPKPCPKPHP